MAQRGSNLRDRHESFRSLSTSKACTLPGIKEVCKILDHVFKNHHYEVAHGVVKIAMISHEAFDLVHVQSMVMLY